MRILCMSLLVFFVAGLSPVVAQDQGPADIVSTYYDKVLRVFSDVPSENTQEIRSRLMDLAQEVFTFQIMARMSLGQRWRDLQPEQQEEFVSLFSELLKSTYFAKIEENLNTVTSYTADDMRVVDEIVFSSRKAEVQSQIVYQNKSVPVDYRFVKLDSGWKIYDVMVEGVSLVQNYRSQFKKILLNSSVQTFMQDLRNKVAAQKSKTGGQAADRPGEENASVPNAAE